MKRFAVVLLLLLASCSAEEPQEAPFAVDDTIECALDGADGFARECGVERIDDDGPRTLVIHHPDGGFRRFVITDDGTGLAAADGADRTQITPRDGAIEVALGGDRYILPATIASDAE